jgi:hypothetical protein
MRAIKVDEQGLPTGPVGLEEALMGWATCAGLEEGIRDARNPKWVTQAKESLHVSEWERIRPLLQKIVDDNQELLVKLARG